MAQNDIVITSAIEMGDLLRHPRERAGHTGEVNHARDNKDQGEAAGQATPSVQKL